MRSDKAHTARGFTVVELTVALLISAMLLASGYELFKTLRSVGDRQDDSMGEAQEIVSVFEQIREDLMHAVPKSYGQEAMFAGASAAPQFEEIELLQFYSLCTTDLSNGVCGLRQIHRVVYELVKEEDSPRLYRTATPVVGKNRLSGDETRRALSDKIDNVTISFHNGRERMPSFSSRECLPVYVELEFTAFGQTWPLTVKVPCGTTGGE